jgi:hypothetical protein
LEVAGKGQKPAGSGGSLRRYIPDKKYGKYKYRGSTMGRLNVCSTTRFKDVVRGEFGTNNHSLRPAGDVTHDTH